MSLREGRCCICIPNKFTDDVDDNGLGTTDLEQATSKLNHERIDRN